MRNRFEDFMYGRYGNDQFNQFLSVIALAVLVVNLFVKIPFLWMGALALLIWTYFRMLSRNTSRRYAENERFLSFISRFRRGGSTGGYAGGRSAAERRAERGAAEDLPLFCMSPLQPEGAGSQREGKD